MGFIRITVCCAYFEISLYDCMCDANCRCKVVIPICEIFRTKNSVFIYSKKWVDFRIIIKQFKSFSHKILQIGKTTCSEKEFLFSRRWLKILLKAAFYYISR